MFRQAPLFEMKHLEKIFRHKVFKMLLSKEKITEELVNMVINPAPAGSGLNVFCGVRIQPCDESRLDANALSGTEMKLHQVKAQLFANLVKIERLKVVLKRASVTSSLKHLSKHSLRAWVLYLDRGIINCTSSRQILEKEFPGRSGSMPSAQC